MKIVGKGLSRDRNKLFRLDNGFTLEMENSAFGEWIVSIKKSGEELWNWSRGTDRVPELFQSWIASGRLPLGIKGVKMPVELRAESIGIPIVAWGGGGFDQVEDEEWLPVSGCLELDTTIEPGGAWNWRPIAEAPKDGSRIMLFHSAGTLFSESVIAIGHYNDDRYSTKPRPFWDHVWNSGNALNLRKNPPTLWAEITFPAQELIDG